MTISQLKTFDPTALDPAGIQQGQIDTHLSGKCGVVYFYNESLVTLLLKTSTGELVGILPATWAQPFVLRHPTAFIDWVAIANQNASTDYTLKAVQGLAYSTDEDTSKLYTGPLIRQASLGNTTNTNTLSSTLSNKTNPAGTNVISLASTAVAGDTADVSNDGLWTLYVTIAGALHQFLKTNAASATLLQLGNANDTVELLGNMLLDIGMQIKNSQQITWLTSGGGFGAGIGADTGGVLTYNSAASNHKFLVVGNAQVAGINGNGIYLQSGKQIVFGSGHEITDCYGIGGTGSGTFGTGAPNNNLFLAFDPSTQSGSSQTIGATRAASTVVTTGAGLAWSASIITY